MSVKCEHKNIAMARTRRVNPAYRRYAMSDAAVIQKHGVKGAFKYEGAQAAPGIVVDRRDTSLDVIPLNQQDTNPIHAISMYTFRSGFRVTQNAWLNAKLVHLNQFILPRVIFCSLKNGPA